VLSQIAMNSDGRGDLVGRYDDEFIVTLSGWGTAAFATYVQTIRVTCGHSGMADNIASHRGLGGTPEQFGFGRDHQPQQ
jgi:hypothetical protein